MLARETREPMRVLDVEVALEVEKVVVGIAVARGCVTEPASPVLAQKIDQTIAVAKTRGAEREGAVRDMLRFGKYKPTGRGKPASEYLLRSAVEDKFPRINNLVDINNWISLKSMLPISLIDLKRAGSDRFVIRRGRAGESYVFNSAGQVIELDDLLLIAHQPLDAPCANPVKDSLATKLAEGSTDVMAVIYAPAALAAAAEEAAKDFEQALREFGKSTNAASALIKSP
jgi:DNA/RNA-binding domain of Phe-tRNA-synthetase-like protein